jgi:hypothetical protein
VAVVEEEKEEEKEDNSNKEVVDDEFGIDDDYNEEFRHGERDKPKDIYIRTYFRANTWEKICIF